MAFINARLPDRVAAGFQGGPEFNTVITDLANGNEFRNKAWVYPRHRYSAEMGLFNETDREVLIAVLWACAGRWGTFRFKDWNDYTATAQPLSPSIGTGTPVQLRKSYTFGATTITRDIKLVTRATVYRDGTPVAGSYSDTTGLFTPSSNWVAGTHTWDGEFEVLVRFASDYNAMTASHRSARTSSIELQEVIE